MPDLIEQFRSAFRESGLTPYRVAKDAGVAHVVLQRFLKGDRDVRAQTFSKLCGALGLTLTKAETKE
jgi:DNA-binding phage protein